METTPEDKKKAAKKEYKRLWAIKNKDRLKKKKSEYYQKNKEVLDLRNKKYAKQHADDIKITHKKYRTKCIEIIKLRGKIYYDQNREKILKNKKIYTVENWDNIKTYHRNYRRNRRKNDPIFKMVNNLRRRMHHALKAQGATKDETTIELLGASQEFVWNHLESQFKEGMTRENNNPKGWHIDHIKPMSSFDLSDHEQLKECCHYTNLQPLWWWENLAKGDKIPKIYSPSG